jgi:hypothetical protein
MAGPFYYSLKQCSMVWGHHRLGAQMDFEGGIRVVPDQDAWTQIYDIDGTPIHIRSKRFGGRVIVSLNQATAMNRDFVLRLIADAQTGLIVAPLFVHDPASGFGWSAPFARIQSLPEAAMARESAALNWVFLCPTLVPLATPGDAIGVHSLASGGLF